MKLYRQAMKGVQTLHDSTPQVVHRDLKSLNFLVTENWQVKLGDFGLSRLNVDANSVTLNKTVGTYHYLAPEIWNSSGTMPYTAKADLYSMGMVLWECVERKVTGAYQRPYSKDFPLLKHDFQVVRKVATSGIRPSIPSEIDPILRDLIERLWHVDPVVRPDPAVVLEAVANLEEKGLDH